MKENSGEKGYFKDSLKEKLINPPTQMKRRGEKTRIIPGRREGGKRPSLGSSQDAAQQQQRESRTLEEKKKIVIK